MNLHIKSFSQLSTTELYEILRLRVDVFVVEQTCPYPELDGADYDCLHAYLEEDGKLLAYLRLYMQDEETKTARIGRVISAERGKGYGMGIVKAGIKAAKEKLSAERIFIEAQTYAIPFYEKAGFEVCGEEFLEDGIPHVPMILEMEE